MFQRRSVRTPVNDETDNKALDRRNESLASSSQDDGCCDEHAPNKETSPSSFLVILLRSGWCAGALALLAAGTIVRWTFPAGEHEAGGTVGEVVRERNVDVESRA